MNGLQDIYNLFQLSFSPGQFVRNLLVALICGFFISRFYRLATQPSNNSRNFVSSLITLTMITAVVIIVIGNNLARAFGLVGAMSIIRFRTAVKDVQDIVFIFFSLTIGMAAGIGLSVISFIGTITIGTVMVVIARAQSYSHSKRDYLLQFTFAPASENDTPYLAVFKKYCKNHQLINMRCREQDEYYELSFHIRLRDISQKECFFRDMSRIDGVRNINLFFDEE